MAHFIVCNGDLTTDSLSLADLRGEIRVGRRARSTSCCRSAMPSTTRREAEMWATGRGNAADRAQQSRRTTGTSTRRPALRLITTGARCQASISELDTRDEAFSCGDFAPEFARRRDMPTWRAVGELTACTRTRPCRNRSPADV